MSSCPASSSALCKIREGGGGQKVSNQIKFKNKTEKVLELQEMILKVLGELVFCAGECEMTDQGN